MLKLALSLLNLGAAFAVTCPDAPDCESCLGTNGTAPFGPTCGWCSKNVTIGAVSAHCVDLYATFDCLGSYSTDQCAAGWECDKSTKQCVSKPGGMTNKTECDEDCKNPTPPPPAPPTPPSPAGKYACNFTDADPISGAAPTGQCIECTNTTTLQCT